MQGPWAELIGSVTLLALGPVVDRLVPRRQKASIHDRLTAYWIRLDDAPIPEFPVIIARKSLELGRRSLGGEWVSNRALYRYLLFSVALSGLAIGSALFYWGSWVGDLAALMATGPKPATEATAIALRDALSGFSARALIAERPEWFVRLVSFNLIFDLTSVACTILFLHALVRYGAAYSLLFVILDLIVALGCAIASFAVAIVLAFPFLIGITAEHNAQSFLHLTNWIAAMLVSVPYALTTLLPTGSFLAVLTLAYAARVVLKVTRRVGLTLLERVADDPAASSMPFTVLTSALWLVMLVARVAWALWTR